MNELQNPVLARPLDKSNMGADVSALTSLLSFLNNPAISGAELPKDKPLGATLPTDPAITPPALTPVKLNAPRAITANRFAFTGRLKVGKDYVANAMGARIVGFAEPLYFLQEYFFGNKNKDLHGARAFLQTVGQWGWGAINDKYPLTPARACFVTMIRSLAQSGEFPPELQVEWSNFGKVKTIWVDAGLRRAETILQAEPGAKMAIVNARFEHEFGPLRSARFEHYHVMCSPKTWAARLAKDGLSDTSPVVKDESERLAAALDADVIRKISAQKTGPMLRAIWNDENTPPPSPRLHTLNSFLRAVEISSIPDNYAAE